MSAQARGEVGPARWVHMRVGDQGRPRQLLARSLRLGWAQQEPFSWRAKRLVARAPAGRAAQPRVMPALPPKSQAVGLGFYFLFAR